MGDRQDALLSSDRPLEDPEEDQLGYAPFAQRLAEAIVNMAPPDGVVIALHGDWGSGKSTVLNFVEKYLRDMPEGDAPAIVRFNPWWFSGQEALTRRFFEQIGVVLSSRFAKTVGKISEHLKTLGELVSKAPVPYASAGQVVSHLAEGRARDVVGIKRKLASSLAALPRRVVVLLDDIDRLSPEEIRQLFKLVRGVGDLPNMVYVMAFARTIVVKALAEQSGVNGDEYLEKIVQVPFELPLPERVLLRQLLSRKLDTIVAGEASKFDQKRWGNIFFEGIDPFLQTPRDVARLANALSITYPAIKEEINPVDFIAIEALRIFCPRVHDAIRVSQDRFTGSGARAGILPPHDGGATDFYDRTVELAPEALQDSVKKLVTRLFPRLGSIWGNIGYSAEFETEWRRQRRVCSAEAIELYFRLSVPTGAISTPEMEQILALAEEPDALERRLLELSREARPDGTSRARAVLERLGDFVDEAIPEAHAPHFVRAFLSVGDQLLLPQDERKGLFWFDNRRMMVNLMGRLLSRLGEPERHEALSGAVASSESLSMAVDLVAQLAAEHGRPAGNPASEAERLVTREHVLQLERTALGRIREAASDGSLLTSALLANNLYRWLEWGEHDEVRSWAASIVESDEGLARFLSAFASKVRSQGMGDAVAEVTTQVDPKYVAHFVDPDDIIERARALRQATSLRAHEQIAVEQFVLAYDMVKKGEDPSDPVSWAVSRGPGKDTG